MRQPKHFGKKKIRRNRLHKITLDKNDDTERLLYCT
jgi:hypothetical protein